MVEASVDSKFGQTVKTDPVTHGSVSNTHHVPGGAVA